MTSCHNISLFRMKNVRNTGKWLMICANYIEFRFENVYTECIRKKRGGNIPCI